MSSLLMLWKERGCCDCYREWRYGYPGKEYEFAVIDVAASESEQMKKGGEKHPVKPCDREDLCIEKVE